MLTTKERHYLAMLVHKDIDEKYDKYRNDSKNIQTIEETVEMLEQTTAILEKLLTETGN